MDIQWKKGQRITVFCSEKESEAVRIAVHNLCTDLQKVLEADIVWQEHEDPGETPDTWRQDKQPDETENGEGITGENRKKPDGTVPDLEAAEGGSSGDKQERALPAGSIVVGTLGVSRAAEAVRGRMEELLGSAACEKAGETDGNRKPDISLGNAEDFTALRREGLYQTVQEGVLYLTGTDRRGTIYAIYDFCRQLGVSPWYYWADVPVHQKQEFALSDGYERADYPSVEYRGIFINDEEELEHWVQLHMGEETIGVRTYEKIFELLLRLKGNYIWPAMHVNSFNVKKENGALAERMGIVVGTSHCDMLMRSNNREWKPWLEQKGYTGVEYDYSLEGRNREILQEYWRESVRQNQDFEVSYTLGMRGIHDSGFEIRALEGLEGEKLRVAKIALLEKIIADQQEILKEELAGEPLQIFIPYKEVMELYDNGLEIPEELTLIWANDNYGYIRRYPGEREKGRKGGNGIYYHNSYWAPPGASYLFICSIPLAHTRNELCKAYEQGIRKLWVMNVGAIKPLEQQIEFYLTYAWEIGKEKNTTEDVDAYLAGWIDRNFTGGCGKEMADVLNQFDQLTNVRKIEQMDTDTFSQTSYGDEAGYRMNRYRELCDRAESVYSSLPAKEKDAFFQLFLMKLHAAYLTNGMYYYADRSALCCRQGKLRAAQKYVALCREYDDARRRLLHYYNKEMSGGKWDGMVTPEDFPPPRTAMYPACVPPLYDTLAQFQEGEGQCEMPQGEKRQSGAGGEPQQSKAQGEQWQEQEAPEGWNASAGAYQCGELVVSLWGAGRSLTLTGTGPKWLEIGDNTGSADIHIQAPEWITLSWNGGKVDGEIRVLVDTEAAQGTGNLVVTDVVSGSHICVAVTVERFRREDAGIICQDAQNREDGGIICLEGTDAGELADAGHLKNPSECNGWKVIPRLGRDKGCLVEAQKQDAVLTYSFALTAQCAPLLELHRFPALDSTGRIGILIGVDDGEEVLLETQANDEKRSTWKTNIRNNVDKLYLQLPVLAQGTHRLMLKSWSNYFSFTRLTLYTQPRRENMLGYVPDRQKLPAEADLVRGLFYGHIPLGPRPVIYAPREIPGDTLLNVDTLRYQKKYAQTVTPAQVRRQGEAVYREADQAIRIDAAAALAESPYAYTTGEHWDYCSSESYGRSGLAMHIRRPGQTWQPGEQAPALHYRFWCQGGAYTIWILMKCNTIEDSHFTIGMDETWLAEKELCGGKTIWRYCAEQVYRWLPLYQWQLEAGFHTLRIQALCSATRFDRIYLTRGEEIPPTDEQWVPES